MWKIRSACFLSLVLLFPSIVSAQEEKPLKEVQSFEVKVGTPPNTFTENVYIVFNLKTRDAIIIDPGAKDERIEKFVKTHKLKVKRILNTHGHYDHIGANRHYADLYGVKIVAHAEDSRFYTEENKKNKPEIFLTEKDVKPLEIKGFEIKVFHTPGHSPGSVCYLINGFLFTGDTLFKNSVGRTWGKSKKEIEKKQKQEIAGIKEKLLPLPEKTPVFPGHGSSSTIGNEKKNNRFLK
jgi:glyoxylase-like metal-dependent hydrolase (beta-lactamase superfamily II)